MARPTSHYFTSQRLRLHYLDWGRRDAPTVLFLHGLQDHAHAWDAIASALCDDFHVVAPDARGHGDSDWSPDGVYLPAYNLCDLAELVDIIGKPEIAIVGHSMGSSLALRFAGLYPDRVRRLACIDGLGNFRPSFSGAAREPIVERWREWVPLRRAMAGRGKRRYASIEEAATRMRAENGGLSDAQLHHLASHGLRRNEDDGSYSWKFDDYTRVPHPHEATPEELQTLWSEITCPVMLAWGTRSPSPHPRETGKVAPFRDAHVHPFEGAGHWVHHDAPEAFAAALRAFL